MLAEPGQRLVEVVHREHDAEVAEGVDRRVPVIGDRRRREKARELDLAVAIRHPHHGDLDALVTQSSDAPDISFDHESPLELEAKLGKERDGGIKRLHHDADVVHPLKRHAAIIALSFLPSRGVRCNFARCRGSLRRFSLWHSSRLLASLPRLPRQAPTELLVHFVMPGRDIECLMVDPNVAYGNVECGINRNRFRGSHSGSSSARRNHRADGLSM